MRVLVVGVFLAVCFFIARPLGHLAVTALKDKATIAPTAPGYADDISRMNATRVHEVWPVPADSAAAEKQIVELLRRAQSLRLPVSIAGARHTMGGHTIAPDGIVINMLPFRAMSLSADRTILTVQAGALWSQVIPYLDANGRSVAVMQSDNNFSVGGSISTNVHGWQSKRPPIAATVRSFRLVTAGGEIVRCSRTENAELFSLALGGYGLFGIILDAELWTVPNEWYSFERYIVPVAEYAAVFERYVERDTTTVMAFGRVSVAPSVFMREAILTVFRRTTPPGDPALPPLDTTWLEPAARAVFRGSVGSKYGKEMRWRLERDFSGSMAGRYVSRNQLLNQSVELFLNRSDNRTEILHEYFVSPGRLTAFLQRMRSIIPQHDVDLLNVTLRDIRRDPDSYLKFANTDVIAIVLLFNHARTPEADSIMTTLTRALIDEAAAHGGTYYLPYRPHATIEQFTRAYPQAREFFARKRALDTGLLFTNKFYLNYGAPL